MITVASLLSCTAEKPADVVIPQETNGEKDTSFTGGLQGESSADVPSTVQYSLSLKPERANRSSIILAVPRGFRVDEAEFQWLVNGEPVPGSREFRFSAAETERGDRVQARATVKGKTYQSQIIRVQNTPPKVTDFRILPTVSGSEGFLSVDAKAEDMDGDDVEIRYQWSKNSEPAGTGAQTDSPVRRGDKIILTMTPFDGTDEGLPVVRETEIDNLPPVIDEHTNVTFGAGIYTYQVNAHDPDGDPLSYELLPPVPEGAMISAGTGLLTWTVPPDFTGSKPVTVSVKDSHNAETKHELTMSINLSE
jgi:hypothetical protein